MVAIHPFRALRYNPDVVGDLSRVIAPPYDVIGPQEQDALYAASPYNIVRLILGKTSPADTEQDSRYTRAKHDFEEWRRQDVLRAESQPALYVLEHRFEDGGTGRSRLGFIGLLELRDALGRDVHRHEATLSAPKQDRTKLLEAVPANLSPIFGVFPDDGRTVQSVLERVKAASPATVEAVLYRQPVRLWVVTDPAVIESITRPLASRAVLIADGHHRFEVAYAQRQRYGALMSYFVSMEDPALRVRPIHRIIARGAGNPELVKSFCRLERADAATLLRWLEEPAEEARFGYLEGSVHCKATILPEALARWLMSPPVSLPVAKLDVSILHGLVLPGMGVPASPASTGGEGTAVRYTGETTEAIRAAADGGSAWLLRGLPLTQVYALAAHGLTLPPKSTYFYPKVPSGLAINPLN